MVEKFVAETTAKFVALWKKLDLITTHGPPRLIPITRSVCSKSCKHSTTKGKFTRQPTRGFYSVRQEQFLTDKERGPDGTFGLRVGGGDRISEEEN